MKPLLVGEANPYQDNAEDADHFALYPEPPNASGGRLCRFVMGLDARTYLRSFDRTDLCFPKWSWLMARRRAAELVAERAPGDVIVLCGAKVAKAFGLPSDPFRVYGLNEEHGPMPLRVTIPHPSGLCRVWHEPDAVLRTRALLRSVGVLPPEPRQVIAASGHDSRCLRVPGSRVGWECVMQCPLAGTGTGDDTRPIRDNGLRGVPGQYR